jgi:hypothetical protein
MKKRLTTLLRNKDHEMYEIWCEWAAESIFFSGKPTQEELEELVMLNWKEAYEEYRNFGTDIRELPRFIKEFVLVEPLRRLYSAVYHDPVGK